MAVFGEYKDADINKAFAILATLLAATYFWGIYNNDIKLNAPAGSDIGRAAIVLFGLSLMSLIMIVADINENIEFIETLLFGDTVKRAATSAAIGAVVVFLVSGGAKSVLPLGIATTVIQAYSFFIVFASPIVEGIFFRGCLDPTLRKTFRIIQIPFPTAFGIIVANVMFAYYHVAVYNLNPDAQIIAFMFGCAMSIGVALTNSLGFEMGSHILNNFIAIGSHL